MSEKNCENLTIIVRLDQPVVGLNEWCENWFQFPNFKFKIVVLFVLLIEWLSSSLSESVSWIVIVTQFVDYGSPL